MPNFDLEKGIVQRSNIKYIAGVDEVGRGSLAGPLVAAAVVFMLDDDIEPRLLGVDDSKKLTAKKRSRLSGTIKDVAADFAVGMASVEEIDSLGVGKANILAFKRALDGLKQADFALIDGRDIKYFDYPYQCLEKGESKSLSIAAASIIAKVYRDGLMDELHKDFPDYGWSGNKGYGSRAHMDTLRIIGPCIHHRRSFLGFLANKN